MPPQQATMRYMLRSDIIDDYRCYDSRPWDETVSYILTLELSIHTSYLTRRHYSRADILNEEHTGGIMRYLVFLCSKLAIPQ